MVFAGAAIVDITPAAGLPMAGFAARVSPATGIHDPLTVRAVAVGDTAIVVADVIGLDAATCRRVKDRVSLPGDCVVVAALHTHGGPVTMPGRLAAPCDEAYLGRLEDAMVTAVDRAVTGQRRARLEFGCGADPHVAKNRRHPGGLVDSHLPLMKIVAEDDSPIAIVTAYACHPVVLGADNTAWTADYPHYVRQALEAAYPGAVALFLTGCAADANTGHTAHASLSLATNPDRTFEAAERAGSRIAGSVLQAPTVEVEGPVAAASVVVTLGFERREREPPRDLARLWRAERIGADPVRATVLEIWASWAESIPENAEHSHVDGRVTVLLWGGVPIIALPGEIFAETALAIRKAAAVPSFVVGYCDDNPGYLPPETEYKHGGYEVDEAHRFYGMPATFAPGSAERLAEAAIALAGRGATPAARSHGNAPAGGLVTKPIC
jgi:neutral ceramidase